MTTRNLILAFACLSMIAAAPAAAKPATYKGKTKGGHSITLKRSGSKVSKLRTLVPTTCVPVNGGTPRAGAELFQPPGSFRVAKTTKAKALQDAAMHYSKVTKNYRVTLIKSKRGRLTGKLHVNFSFQTLGSSAFGGYSLITWICQGDDRFSLRPRS